MTFTALQSSRVTLAHELREARHHVLKALQEFALRETGRVHEALIAIDKALAEVVPNEPVGGPGDLRTRTYRALVSGQTIDKTYQDNLSTSEVLHILRNPSGWSDEVKRNARLKAADLIEGSK